MGARVRWSAGSRRPASWNLEGIPTRMILQGISRKRPQLALSLFAGALTPTVDRTQRRNPVLSSSSAAIGTTGVRTTRDERVDRSRLAAATADAGELSGHPRPWPAGDRVGPTKRTTKRELSALGSSTKAL
jgi:hypothetical protein